MYTVSPTTLCNLLDCVTTINGSLLSLIEGCQCDTNNAELFDFCKIECETLQRFLENIGDPHWVEVEKRMEKRTGPNLGEDNRHVVTSHNHSKIGSSRKAIPSLKPPLPIVPVDITTSENTRKWDGVPHQNIDQPHKSFNEHYLDLTGTSYDRLDSKLSHIETRINSLLNKIHG